MNSSTREAVSLGSVSAFRDQYDPVLRESSVGSRVALVDTENVPVKTFDISVDDLIIRDVEQTLRLDIEERCKRWQKLDNESLIATRAKGGYPARWATKGHLAIPHGLSMTHPQPTTNLSHPRIPEILKDEYLGKLQSLLHTVPEARTILKSLEDAKPLCLKHLKTSIDRDSVATPDTFLQSWELSKCAEEFRAIEYQPCSLSSVPTSGDITKYERDAEEMDEACIAPNSVQFRDKLKQEVIVSFSLYGKSHSSGGKMQRLQDVDILSDQTLRQLKDSFYCGGGGRGRGSAATTDPSDASIADEHSYFFIEGTFYATDTLLPKADGRAGSGTSDVCHISAVKEWLLSDKHVTQPSPSSTDQHAQKESNAASSRNAEAELSDVPAQTQDYEVAGEDTGVEDDARILAALRMCTESSKPRGRKVQKRQGSDKRTRIVSHGEEDAHNATACDVSSAIAPADNAYASSASAVIAGVDRGSNDATATTAPNDKRKKSKVDGSRRSSRLRVPVSSVYDSWTSGMDDPDDDRCVSSEGATSSSSSSAALITTTAPVVTLPSRGKEKVKDKRPSRAVKAKNGSLADRPKCTEKRADPGLLELHGLAPDCALDALSLDIPISSLKLRAGVRYLYRHGASTTCDCEHFFYVTDMHLYCPTANSPDTSQAIASHHMRDPPLRRMYPRQTFYAKAVAKKCAICLLWGASYIVFGDRLADKSPLLYCRHCYFMMHYSPSGELIYSDFTVLPYNT